MPINIRTVKVALFAIKVSPLALDGYQYFFFFFFPGSTMKLLEIIIITG